LDGTNLINKDGLWKSDDPWKFEDLDGKFVNIKNTKKNEVLGIRKSDNSKGGVISGGVWFHLLENEPIRGIGTTKNSRFTKKKNIYENLFTLFFCLIKNKGNCSKQSAAPSIKLFRKNQKKYFIKKNKPRIFWWFRCHECIICLKVEGKYHLRLPHINS
jgi:hypothetical protein